MLIHIHKCIYVHLNTYIYVRIKFKTEAFKLFIYIFFEYMPLSKSLHSHNRLSAKCLTYLRRSTFVILSSYEYYINENIFSDALCATFYTAASCILELSKLALYESIFDNCASGIQERQSSFVIGSFVLPVLTLFK